MHQVMLETRCLHHAVGEDLQQRQHFSGEHGLQAKDVTQLLPCTGDAAPGTNQAAGGEGLAVQIKVIQAGAAMWLPAQQGCNWPVDVMLEVCAPQPLVFISVMLQKSEPALKNTADAIAYYS